jgi:hypothetical protein
MKRLALAVLALSLAAPAAFAQDAAPAKETGKDHPCQRIEQACKAAGFVKGGAKEGKGLYANCMKPILKGKSVAGVTVDAATLQSCQGNMAKAAQHDDKNKEDSSKSKQ